MTFGFNKLRQGSQIGLPVGFFAKNVEEVLELSPPNGFENFLGKKFKYHEIEKKLGTEVKKEFLQSLLLSEDSKLFGLAHAIAKSNNFVISCMPNYLEAFAFALAYMSSYMCSRRYRMHLNITSAG